VKAVPRGSIFSQATECITDSVNYMQGQDFLGKPIVVFGGTEVQFSDGNHFVANGFQMVSPSFGVACIRISVTPITGLVNIATRLERSPSWYAYRAICIGVFE
jgi:hypothetical protein